jgi:hypothetical protein
VKRKQPKARVETISQSTHLVPLERPKEVFEIMQSFLSEILESDSLLSPAKSSFPYSKVIKEHHE